MYRRCTSQGFRLYLSFKCSIFLPLFFELSFVAPEWESHWSFSRQVKRSWYPLADQYHTHVGCLCTEDVSRTIPSLLYDSFQHPSPSPSDLCHSCLVFWEQTNEVSGTLGFAIDELYNWSIDKNFAKRFPFATVEYGKRGGQMVSALDSGSGSSPGRGSALCSCARHFTLMVPLSTQVYKWVLANLMLGVTLRWTSIPSRGE